MPQTNIIFRVPFLTELAYHSWLPLFKKFIKEKNPLFWIPSGMSETELMQVSQMLEVKKEATFLKDNSSLSAFKECCFMDLMPIKESTFPDTFLGRKVAAVGGFEQRDLIEQVRQCRLQKVDAIASEVLPDELPIKTTPIDLDYFSKRFVFLPSIYESIHEKPKNGEGVLVIYDSKEKISQLPVAERDPSAYAYIDEPIDCSVILPALKRHFKVTVMDLQDNDLKTRDELLNAIQSHQAVLNATQHLTVQASLTNACDTLNVPMLCWHESVLSPLRVFLGLGKDEPLEYQVFATNKSLRQKVESLVSLLQNKEKLSKSLDEVKKYTVDEGLKVLSNLTQAESVSIDKVRDTYKKPISLNPLNPDADPGLKQYYFPYIPKNAWLNKPQSVKVISQALQDKNEMRRRRWMTNVAAHLFSWPYQENWMRIFKYYLLQDNEWIDHCYQGIQSLYLQDSKTTDLLGLLGQSIIHCLAIEEELEEPYASSSGKRLEALAKALKFFDEDAAIGRNSDKTPYRFFYHKAAVYAILEAYEKVDALIDAAYEANHDIKDTYSSIGAICARAKRKEAAVRFTKKDFELGRMSPEQALMSIKILGKLKEELLAKKIIEHFYKEKTDFRGGYTTWVYNSLDERVHDFFCKDKWADLAKEVISHVKWVEKDVELKRDVPWTARFLVQLNWICNSWDATQKKLKEIEDAKTLSDVDQISLAYYIWGMDSAPHYKSIVDNVDLTKIKSQDTHPESVFLYAFLKIMLGDVDEGTQVLQDFVDEHPAYFTPQTPVLVDVNHWLLLAILYRIGNEDIKAQKALDLAKQLEPTFPHKEYLFKRGVPEGKVAAGVRIPPVKLFSTH